VSPRLDLVGLVVNDMATSLAFYRELGLEIPPEADSEDHVETTLPGGLRLAWDAFEVIRSFEPEWTQASGSARVGFAFLCDSPTDVDTTYERLVGLGYHGRKQPWDAFWGQRYALIDDPDGNDIGLLAPLAE
jgi:catechol 2,3-dioxygenase-like lactoylglutathione lyase family enzyme